MTGKRTGGPLRHPPRSVVRAVLVVVIAAVLQVVTGGEAFGVAEQTPVALAYVSIFLLVAGDAVIPVLPARPR